MFCRLTNDKTVPELQKVDFGFVKMIGMPIFTFRKFNMKYLILFYLTLQVCTVKGQDHYLLVGTYDSPKSEGIYVYKFNSKTGTLLFLQFLPMKSLFMLLQKMPRKMEKVAILQHFLLTNKMAF